MGKKITLKNRLLCLQIKDGIKVGDAEKHKTWNEKLLKNNGKKIELMKKKNKGVRLN